MALTGVCSSALFSDERQFDWDVGLLECRDLVMVGLRGIGFVGRTFFQVQVQAILTLGNENAFAGQRDAWIGGIGDVCEKHSIPNGSSLGAVHVLHVEHEFGKTFIEHARLHFVGNLRAFELIFEASERCQRPGRQIKSVGQSEQPGGGDKNCQHASKVPHAHAAGAHGGDLAVGGEAAQPDENPYQHAHGDRVGERERHGVEEDLGDAR